MSILEYINPTQVHQHTPALLELITCRICSGIVFNPVMCAKCKNLFCSSHNKQFLYRQFTKELSSIQKSVVTHSQPCYCGDHLTKNFDEAARSALSQLKIKCDCSYLPHPYKDFLKHKPKCTMYKFKVFYLISNEDNGRVGLTNGDNASLNMNLLNKNYVFRMNDYQVWLTDLKIAYDMYCGSALKMPEKGSVVYELKFKEKDSMVIEAYWFFDGGDNPYQTYADDVMERLEKRYQEYLREKKEGKEGKELKKTMNFERAGIVYTVCFEKMQQTRSSMKTNPRKVYRQEF